MAKIANPRKKFNFSIHFDKHAVNDYLCQEVELPEVTIEQVAHGDTNRDVKTPGRITVGDLTVRVLKRTSQSETWFWDWAMMCQDMNLGGGNTPDAAWSTITLSEIAEDGKTVLDTWTMTECWPKQISSLSMARTSSDNTIQEIVFSVGTLDNNASSAAIGVTALVG
jgi:phage tail-like protein